MSDMQPGNEEIARLKEKLRVLQAENFRLRASVAAALAREDHAEDVLRHHEEELLLLRRRTLYWYLNEIQRPFRKLMGGAA